MTASSWQLTFVSKWLLPFCRRKLSAAFRDIPKEDHGKRIVAVRKILDVLGKNRPGQHRLPYVNLDCNGVPAELVYNGEESQKFNRVILYFHGGGYALLNPQFYRPFVAQLAEAANVSLLCIDYRLSPEHRFPSQRDDAIAAYDWLRTQTAPENIIIAGDSAGGNLTVSTLLQLKKLGAPMPRAAVCFSPWLDLMHSGDSFEINWVHESMLPAELLAKTAEVFCQPDELYSPEVSPVFASTEDVEGLPPFLLHVGDREILRDDSLRFANLLKKANVEVETRLYDDGFHVFEMFSPYVPESKKALRSAAYFIRRHLHGEQKSPPRVFPKDLTKEEEARNFITSCNWGIGPSYKF